MEFDLVLFGATGFTGQLCARYLSDTYGPDKGVKWAIAGRSLERLTSMQCSMKLDCGIIVADTSDPSSINYMVQRAHCIANLVGPYLRLNGLAVVESCVRLGRAYIDLTGESEFYSQVIDRFHEAAQKTGALVVPSAGFDSVPGDLTAFLAAQSLFSDVAEEDDEIVEAWVGISTFGWFSSGTIESLIVMAKEGGDMIRSTRADWLSPIKEAKHENVFQLWRHHPIFHRYGAWLFFAPHNTRVAYRTWGMIAKENQRGQRGDTIQFSPFYRYQEAIMTPAWLLTVLTSIVIKTFTLLLVFVPMFGSLLTALLIRNGGPPKIIRESLGYMDARTIIRTRKGRTRICVMSSRGDPGYHLTSRMLVETGLTIAKTPREKMHSLAQVGGVLTPSLAGGEGLASRLRQHAGFNIYTSG